MSETLKDEKDSQLSVKKLVHPIEIIKQPVHLNEGGGKKRAVGFVFKSGNLEGIIDKLAMPRAKPFSKSDNKMNRMTKITHTRTEIKEMVLSARGSKSEDKCKFDSKNLFSEAISIFKVISYGYYTLLSTERNQTSGVFFNSRLNCKFSILALFEPIENEITIRCDTISKIESLHHSRDPVQDDNNSNNISWILSTKRVSKGSQKKRLDISDFKITNSLNIFSSIVKQNLFESYSENLNHAFKVCKIELSNIEEAIENTICQSICNSELFSSSIINKEEHLNFNLLTMTVSRSLNIASIGNRAILYASELGSFVCIEKCKSQVSKIQTNNYVLKSTNASANFLDIITLSLPKTMDFILVLNTNIIRQSTYVEVVAFIYGLIFNYNLQAHESSSHPNPTELTDLILSEFYKKYFENVSQYTSNLVNIIVLSDRAIQLSKSEMTNLKENLSDSKKIKQANYSELLIKRHISVNLSTKKVINELNTVSSKVKDTKTETLGSLICKCFKKSEVKVGEVLNQDSKAYDCVKNPK